MLKCKQISHKPIYIVIVTAYFNPLNFYVVQMISVTQKVFHYPIPPDSQTWKYSAQLWSLYEIIHICTAVEDESEEWSSQ